MAEPARHLTARTLAAYWGVTRGSVYRLIRDGKLGHLRIGGAIRITWRDVADYETRNACPARDTTVPGSASSGDQAEPPTTSRGPPTAVLADFRVAQAIASRPSKP